MSSIIETHLAQLTGNTTEAEVSKPADLLLPAPPPAESLEVFYETDEPKEKDFADALEARLPECRTQGKVWYVDDGKRWKITDWNIFRPLAQAILPPDYRTAYREKQILAHLEGRFQVAAENLCGAIKFCESSGDVLLNVNNGVLRVNREEPILEPHNSTHGFTQVLAADFDKDAVCETFDRVLKESLPDEQDQLSFKINIGNLLYPSSKFETSLVCHGAAGTGKSTIAEAVSNVFGSELVTRLSLAQVCDTKSYALPKLQYALTNLGTELDALGVEESGNFKAITSGEPIEVRPIYCAPFTMKTTAKLWWLANQLPRFKNGTDAEVRRMRFFEFRNKPAQIDLNLKQKLLSEQSGILNYVISGLIRLIALQKIPFGGADSQRIRGRFAINNDPIGQFVGGQCKLGAEVWTPKDRLYQAYQDFCDDNGFSQEKMNDTWFFRKLLDQFAVECTRRTVNGQLSRIITGIDLATICPF